MKRLPSGTVTFLFTDIEGSTKLAQTYPDQWETLCQRHNAILRSAIESHNGYIFNIIGDAFCAAFHTVPEALKAAIEIQHGLSQEAWDPVSIQVRMGINTGMAHIQHTDEHLDDYNGYATLALVQRVMSSSHGGQILLSNASAELLRAEMPRDISLQNMGEYRLKGLIKPEQIWQANAPGLLHNFPPLQSLNVILNNLPIQLTSFIGRTREIVDVKHALEQYRLVTLTGSGGTGKTRLSLQVAAEMLSRFDQGVWFVELAPVANPEQIPFVLLSVFGLSEQPDKTPLGLLENYLHEKNLLLIFDNCEHLIEACAKYANAILSAAPNIKILASSREALGVQGEFAWHVPSLSLPDPKHPPVFEVLSQCEAVRLFTERALLAAPNFELTRENAPAIAQICYRLDGIPLAIELAAARLKMLSVNEIAKRLDDRFRLLTGGARTALPRQQTLRALIDWSYDLLSEQERTIFRRLSVFAGGWTLEAAELVCAAGNLDVLNLLTHLVDKSLVNSESENEETRYRFLETIRQYAREKLLESGEIESIRDQHMMYFVEFAEQAEPELFKSNQLIWIKRIKKDQDNLRAALSWSLEQHIEEGLRLANAQTLFWIFYFSISEAKDWFSRLMNHPEISISIPVRAKALIAEAQLDYYDGKLSDGLRACEESLDLHRQLRDRQGEADNLYILGALHCFKNDLRKGRKFLYQGLEICKELQDKARMADILTFLGGVGSRNKNTTQAGSLLEQGLALYREVGHIRGIGFCLTLLGRQEMWNGDFMKAHKSLEEALLLLQQVETQDILETMDSLGDLAFHEGDYEQARQRLEECRLRSHEIGREVNVSWAIVGLGYVAIRQREQTVAYDLLIEGLNRFAKSGSKIGVIFSLEGLASLAVDQRQYEKAGQIFAWADKARQEMDDQRQPVEQMDVDHDFQIIQKNLDQMNIKSMTAEGHAMTMEAAIALASEA